MAGDRVRTLVFGKLCAHCCYYEINSRTKWEHKSSDATHFHLQIGNYGVDCCVARCVLHTQMQLKCIGSLSRTSAVSGQGFFRTRQIYFATGMNGLAGAAGHPLLNGHWIYKVITLIALCMSARVRPHHTLAGSTPIVNSMLMQIYSFNYSRLCVCVSEPPEK